MNIFDKWRNIFPSSVIKVIPMPPPYTKMLAINSDVEWTSWDSQIDLFHYFADRNIEVAFSFWLYGNPAVTWRLFNDDGSKTKEFDRAVKLMKAGMLDTNHSIGGRRHQGGCEFNRKTIIRAYQVLNDLNIHPKVYTNHGSIDDKQNVAGEWAAYQEGDLPSSDFYHLDITRDLGAVFFWCDPDYIIDRPYLLPELNKDNGLFLTALGRDGTPYLRFRRYMGGGLKGGPSLDNFHLQLDSLLNSDENGYSVVFQHLGVFREKSGRPAKADTRKMPIEVIEAFDALASAQNEGNVLITTTEKLLLHAALMTAQPWEIKNKPACIEVKFKSQFKLDAVIFSVTKKTLSGWCIEDIGKKVEAYIGEQPVVLIKFTSKDKKYIGLPWRKINMNETLDEIS